MSKDFVFVSGNLKKVDYIEQFLGRKVEHYHVDLDEIQSLDHEKVVEHKAKEAYKILGKPVAVDDTSLVIHALGRLPGPLIKFFLKELGTEGISKIISNFEDKTAKAGVIYGFFDGTTLKTFAADVDGKIPNEPRGGKGMGWDSIFIPAGQAKTYAEMDEQELLIYSVRNRAVQKLKAFLDKN